MSRDMRADAVSWPSFMPTSFADVVVLVGGLAYGAVFASAQLFYGPLGIEPADVGLGYGDLLGQAAIFLAVALLTGVVATLGIAGVARLRARKKSIKPALRDEVARTFRSRRRLVVTVTLALVLGDLFGEAIWQSNAVRTGEAATGFSSLLPWSDTEAANVVWADGSSLRPSIPFHCVVRLGESGGTEIFYDHWSHQTLRLPQSEIKVTIQPGENCPKQHDG